MKVILNLTSSNVYYRYPKSINKTYTQILIAKIKLKAILQLQVQNGLVSNKHHLTFV